MALFWCVYLLNLYIVFIFSGFTHCIYRSTLLSAIIIRVLIILLITLIVIIINHVIIFIIIMIITILVYLFDL